MKTVKKIMIIVLMIVTLSGMMLFTSCGSVDSDGDGLTDDFEDDIGTDSDSYDFNDAIDWDQAEDNYNDNN